LKFKFQIDCALKFQSKVKLITTVSLDQIKMAISDYLLLIPISTMMIEDEV